MFMELCLHCLHCHGAMSTLSTLSWSYVYIVYIVMELCLHCLHCHGAMSTLSTLSWSYVYIVYIVMELCLHCSYVIDDCQYMMNQQDKQLKSKTPDTNGTSATGDTGSVSVSDTHANGFSTTETDIGHNVPTTATNYGGRVKLSHRPRKTFLQ